jgi:hypothetical protein
MIAYIAPVDAVLNLWVMNRDMSNPDSLPLISTGGLRTTRGPRTAFTFCTCRMKPVRKTPTCTALMLQQAKL